MNRKVIFSLFLIFLTLLAFSSPLTVIFEPYPTFSYMKDFTLEGLAVDVVRGISEKIDSQINVEFTKWDIALERLRRGNEVVIPTVIMNEDRKDDFKWVGPIAVLKTSLYKKTHSLVEIKSLQEARQIETICVVKDYYSTEFLQKNGFEISS